MDTGASDIPDGLGDSRETVPLDAQERALSDALAAKDPRLAQMYLGAITVLMQVNNPDRLALASHGLREVMEKIPRYIDVETAALDEKLGEQVRTLEDVWMKATGESSCRQSETWSGQIDLPLVRLLDHLAAFFEWLAKHRPRRRSAIMDAMRQLDPSGMSLPEPLERRTYKTWDNLQRYFNNVSHHNWETNEEQFEERRDELEEFLLDKLSPRTFADFDEIDAIIREGKHGA